MKLMNKFALTGVLLSTTALPLGTASASIIHNNGGPSIFSSVSDTDSPTNIRSADDFAIAPGTLPIQSISWSGLYTNNAPNAPDDFTINFFLDNAGTPDPVGLITSLMPGNAVNRVDSSFNTPTGMDIYNYHADVGSLSLAAGNYWVSIVNNTSADADDDWRWSYSSPVSAGGNAAYIGGTASSWTMIGGEMSFALHDAPVTAVPVPAAIWLMGSALLGLVGVRFKKTA